MPRVPQPSSHPLSSSDPLAAGNANHPNVLKRNQACHQCRRRKLKCDAKRPCSTCIRSHAHAVSHSPPGSQLSPHPECTFDDVVEVNATVNEGPKSRYERLENRINELEALLVQKEKAEGNGVSSPTSSLSHRYSSLSTPSDSPKMSPNFAVESFANYHAVVDGSPGAAQYHSSHSAMAVKTSTQSMASPVTQITALPTTSSSPDAHASIRGSTGSPYGLDLIWPNWPPNLPNPDLLRHLVEVFFVFHPHANRLFHATTFMSSLSLPPSHPKFPATPVLHAICAMGSFYTAAVSSPPLPNFDAGDADEIFLLRHRLKEERPDSFAEQHAKYARETADTLEKLGDRALQVMQAHIIISWFYWSHSRWVDVFMHSAHALRLCVPLGLNMCPPFHSISKLTRPASLLPAARTVIEDECRRNVFWLCYALERTHGLGNGWALSLDDQDISQLLPVRGDQFEQGILVTPQERQWAHSKDLLLVHDEKQTDSFILYIKGTILISQVKSFNSRFRARHFAGDPSVASPKAFYQESNSPESIDPRGSPAFIELDDIIASFRASFPSHLRNPINENVVDSHLYTACLIPHTATIVLHDPHAEVRRSGCVSALKILTAARAILDLIYNVWSTSYDITLLDPFCSFCWFVAGRVLVRFLEAAIETNSQDQIATIRAELEFIQLAVAKVGERIPLALRFAKMLDDLIISHCGPQDSLSPVTIAQLAFPRQLTSDPGVHNILPAVLGGDSLSHDRFNDPISFATPIATT